jgi:hypothetical protein
VRRLPAPLAVLIAVLAAAPAQAATLHISPSGTGSSCTQASPCDTIREGYAAAQPGDTIQLAPGTYPRQGTFSDPATAIGGTKQVTVRGSGVKVRQIFSRAANVTFDGLDLDADGVRTSGAVFEAYGANTVFRNGRIGNVVDEKGALVAGGSGMVFENVDFHDVIVTSPAVHNECIFSMAPNITIRNSRFTNCATMDVFFTTNGSQYSGFKLLDNFFGASKRPGGANHFYTVAWHRNLGAIRSAEIRRNTFELPVNNDGMSAVNSVGSCNTPQVNLPGIAHEPCNPLPNPDSDGDGVPDAVDACPGQAGSQPNGCNPPPPPPPDRDGDGRPDSTDLCPDLAGQAPDGCLLPQPVYNPACAPTCDGQIAALETELDRALQERDQARQQRDAAEALAAQRKAKLDRILAILQE